MEDRSDAGKYTVVNAMWNGLRKPLFCALLMFGAALLLIDLQARKTAFDKKQNAPYVLVSDATPKPADDVHYAPVPPLAKAVKQDVTAEYADKRLYSDPGSVVLKSAEEASAQNFKSPIELFLKLNEGIIRQKNAEISAAVDANRKARLSVVEIDQIETDALAELDKKVVGENVDVSALVAKNGSSPYLQIALKEKYPNGGKNVPAADVRTSVTAFYAARKLPDLDLQQKSAQQISSIENLYQQISNKTHQQLTGPSTTFSFVSPSASTADANIGFLLDDKKGLNGLYWLVRVVLSGVVLFAFLYLILIPLKYVFFWTTSGDILTEHARKLLERKDGVTAATPVARAAIVAVTAAAVGTVTLAASNLPFASTPVASPKDIGKAVASELAPGKPPTVPDFKGGFTAAEMERLMTNFETLGNRINYVENAIDDLDINPQVDTRKFEEEVGKFNGLLGPSDGQDPSSVFGRLNNLQRDQVDFGNKVDTRFNTLDGLIGKDTSPFNQPSLFGRLNGMSDTLGMRSNNSPQRPDLTVVDSLRNLTTGLGTSTSTDNSTLFGKTNSTQQSVTDLTGVASSIRRDQLGTSGRNFFTQTKTMFSGERFRVSVAAVAEIERELAGNQPALVAALRNLISERLYSEGELKAAIGGPASMAWSKTKSTILRYTRVARY